MIITTSPFIEGHKVSHYCGIVVSTVGFPDRVRSSSSEKVIEESKEFLINSIKRQAENLSANAIISLSISPYSHLSNQHMMASGTAVTIEPHESK